MIDIVYSFRMYSTRSVSSWSAFMSWATTPMLHGTTQLCSRLQGAAVEDDGPVPRGSGMCPSMGKAGQGGALRHVAQTKPPFSCPECWATRTMRWCGSSVTARGTLPHSRALLWAMASTGDGDTVAGKAEQGGQMTDTNDCHRAV